MSPTVHTRWDSGTPCKFDRVQLQRRGDQPDVPLLLHQQVIQSGHELGTTIRVKAIGLERTDHDGINTEGGSFCRGQRDQQLISEWPPLGRWSA
ncbi:hypothetical protein D9M72_534920 [compost metagenome]